MPKGIFNDIIYFKHFRGNMKKIVTILILFTTILFATDTAIISDLPANVIATYIESTNTIEITGNGKFNKSKYWNFLDNVASKYNKSIRSNNFTGYDININIKENIQLPDDSSTLFGNYQNRLNKSIFGNIEIDENIDTSNVTNVYAMFKEVQNANPNLSNWNTVNVN